LHCGNKISSKPESDPVGSKHVAVWIILYSCVWWLFVTAEHDGMHKY